SLAGTAWLRHCKAAFAKQTLSHTQTVTCSRRGAGFYLAFCFLGSELRFQGLGGFITRARLFRFMIYFQEPSPASKPGTLYAGLPLQALPGEAKIDFSFRRFCHTPKARTR